MRELLNLLIHIIITVVKLSRPGGIKAVMAENIAMRQQLITLARGRQRAPKLKTSDRNGTKLSLFSTVFTPVFYLFHFVSWSVQKLEGFGPSLKRSGLASSRSFWNNFIRDRVIEKLD